MHFRDVHEYIKYISIYRVIPVHVPIYIYYININSQYPDFHVSQL